MSSVSFNSFIYFVLNRHYRQELANLTRCASWKHFRNIFAIFGKEDPGEELKLSGPYEHAGVIGLKNGNSFGGIGTGVRRSPQAVWTPIAAKKVAPNGVLQKEVIIQDANNNSQTAQNGLNPTGSGSKEQTHRVRYVSEKPANCKIIFRSRFASNASSASSNVPCGRALLKAPSQATSSSSSASGDTYREFSSGVSKGSGGGVRGRSAIKVTGPNGKPCKLQRSNAVRVSGGGVSTASMASSNGSRSFDEPRGSDI